MSGSGISWAICKSAPRSRQITMPAPHHSVFTGRMPFLSPNQQCQSTEVHHIDVAYCYLCLDLHCSVFVCLCQFVGHKSAKLAELIAMQTVV